MEQIPEEDGQEQSEHLEREVLPEWLAAAPVVDDALPDDALPDDALPNDALPDDALPGAPDNADSALMEIQPPHDAPTRMSGPHAQQTDAAIPAVSPGPSRHGLPARMSRLAPARTRLAVVVPGALVLLLAVIVLASLGVQHWGLIGMAGIGAQRTVTPSATATATATATRAPTPTPTATPDPMIARNLAMGCAQGHPPSAAQVVFGTKDYQTGGPAPREVALTFDDGPTPYTSPPILDYLEQSHTPATFFVMGQYARLWPYLIQREWADGFAIGVHTWDHPVMTSISDAQLAHQFGDTLAAIHAAIGQDACIWFWRPPYGSFNGHVISYAQHYGLTTIQWDADPADWSRPGVDVIVSRVLAQAHPGSIILMHDGPARREQTRAALPQIVAGLRQRGLTPVTLPQLLADSHYPGVATAPQSIPPNVSALPVGAIPPGPMPTGLVPIIPEGSDTGA